MNDIRQKLAGFSDQWHPDIEFINDSSSGEVFDHHICNNDNNPSSNNYNNNNTNNSNRNSNSNNSNNNSLTYENDFINQERSSTLFQKHHQALLNQEEGFDQVTLLLQTLSPSRLFQSVKSVKDKQE
jgi:hypothetical protein